MMPTFFIAGVPKAGTTSMYNYLLQHPQVFMSGNKEPHFFSWEDGWPAWAVKDPAAYEALFDQAAPGQQRGEASTWTLYSSGAPHRIARAVPDARFIVLLRHPTARAFSNWAFNYGNGWEPLDSFEAALAAEPQRLASGASWSHHYTAASRYHAQVERYYEVFGPDRLLILTFEDLKADAARVTRQAYDFLGIDPTFTPDVGGVHNATALPRSRWLHRMSWSAGPAKRTVKNVMPRRLASYLGRQVKAMNRVAPPGIDPQTRERLDASFRDDVSKLSHLVGRDFLAAWSL